MFEKIGEKPLLRWSYDSAVAAERHLRTKNIQSITRVLGPKDDTKLQMFCESELISAIFPDAPENDLLTRYLKGTLEMGCDALVRITADCWQTHPQMICEVVEMLIKDCDYVSNTMQRTFLEGLDLQACTLKALRWFDEHQSEDREHPFMHFDQNKVIRDGFEKKMKYGHLFNPQAHSVIKTSIDIPQDLEKARKIYDEGQKSRQILDRAQ